MFLDFKGDEHEFELSFARFFLRNTERLASMIISTYWMCESDNNNKSRLEEVKRQMLAYPMLCNIAELDFIINVRGNYNPETSAFGNEILKLVLRFI